MSDNRHEAERLRQSFASQLLTGQLSHQQNQQIEISSLDVSTHGKYAATISYFLEEKNHMARVDRWDISLLSHDSFIQQDTGSVGSTRFNTEAVRGSLKVVISPTGSHLAMFKMTPNTHSDNCAPTRTGCDCKRSFPLQAHYFDNDSTADNTDNIYTAVHMTEGKQTQPQQGHLIQLPLLHDSILSTFTGFCRFFPNKPDPDPVLVTCDGLRMDVFDISRGFQILYSISLEGFFTINTDFLRPEDSQEDVWKATQWMMHDLDSRFFGRDIDCDTVSIWNWRTGSNICYLDVPFQEQGLRRVLFSDSGSLTVVAGNESGSVVADWQTREVLVFRIYDMTCLHNFIELEPSPMEGVLDLRVLTNDTVQDGSLGCIMLNNGSRILVRKLQAINGGQRRSSEICPIACETIPATDDKQDDTLVCEVTDQGCLYKISIENGATKFTLFRKQDTNWIELLAGNTKAIKHGDHRYTDSKDDANDHIIKIIFLSCKSRFVVIQGQMTHLWKLPAANQDTCQLLTVSTFKNLSSEYAKADICVHERSLRLTLGNGQVEHVDISGTQAQQMSAEQTLACVQSIPYMLRSFEGYSLQYQNGVIEFVMQHINRCCIVAPPSHVPLDTPKDLPDTLPFLCQSVMVQVVRHYHRRNFDAFLAAILDYTGKYSWIPHQSLSDPRDSGLVLFLLEHSRAEMAQKLIDYCIHKAHQSHVGYIDYLTETLRFLQDKYPEVSKDIAQRSAFIPAPSRRFMVLNAVMNGPLWQPQFRKTRKPNLHEFRQPVFNCSRSYL
ncbi:hypothetical protein BGX26_000704 [Mortierella sp. AD094]|nr:hypothetical protein BGX26_000704 [Mortierella sp. AD094]